MPARRPRSVEWLSGPVSRVLSFKTAIYLGRTLPHASSRLPACTERLNRIACLFALASDGVYLSHVVTNVLVRSYRTFSAFLLTPEGASGSLSFFSTNPSGFPARPLAGILPQEARTFLVSARLPRPSGPHSAGYSSMRLRCGGQSSWLLQSAQYRVKRARAHVRKGCDSVVRKRHGGCRIV